MGPKMIQTTITIFRPNGDEERKVVPLPATPSLKQLSGVLVPLLGDCTIEHVSVLHNGKHSDLFVDEQFIEKDLPFNPNASAIYRASWLSRHPNDNPDAMPGIQGTAVLFSRRVWF